MKRLALVGLAIGVTSLGGLDWTSRRRLEQRYQMTVAENQELAQTISDLRSEQTRLSDGLQRTEAQVAELTNAVVQKDEALQQAIARVSEEERTTLALREALAEMRRQLDRVQTVQGVAVEHPSSEQAAKPAEEAVELERVVVSVPSDSEAGVEGQILSVHPDWQFVVIDLGWDAVHVGDVVSIYLRESLRAKARVERVQERASAATLLPEWSDADIQVHDVVRIL